MSGTSIRRATTADLTEIRQLIADAWVWDMYRPARFVKQVRVITFKDVNIEEVEKPELRLPE